YTHAISIVTPYFFNDTTTTEIYTLSLHDALPISKKYPGMTARSRGKSCRNSSQLAGYNVCMIRRVLIVSLVFFLIGLVLFWLLTDRKSTRLNSSHVAISYAVFCLKKKKIHDHTLV